MLKGFLHTVIGMFTCTSICYKVVIKSSFSWWLSFHYHLRPASFLSNSPTLHRVGILWCRGYLRCWSWRLCLGRNWSWQFYSDTVCFWTIQWAGHKGVWGKELLGWTSNSNVWNSNFSSVFRIQWVHSKCWQNLVMELVLHILSLYPLISYKHAIIHITITFIDTLL